MRGVSTEHTFGTTPTYSGQYFIYDVMSRLWKQSNPTEMNGSWVATGDEQVSGWKYTIQTYDWKGRPLVTTNTDLTTREMTYSGCGCAGGEQVTTKDERGRQKRLSKDVQGRLVKVEELNYDGTVYSTTNYTYDALDHLTQTNQAGQTRTFDYDRHGRLSSRITPEQGTTTYTYNADDTVLKTTDARGATTTFAYNNRNLPTTITYGVPAGVGATPNVTFAYDAAGNRTSMTDGLGTTTYHYDSMSRLDWEQRSFTGLTGTYKLSYAYNLAGELTNLTGPSQFGSIQMGYTYDKTGRTTAVTGSGYGNVTSYINSISYRAFGAAKQIAYGNTKTLTTTYDTRLRLTKWDVPGAQGWTYSYSTAGIPEKTGRVAFANNLYDGTLDRSYDYDQVGRLTASHTGTEGNGHANGTSPWPAPTGPYAENYAYDQWGNMTWRNGWGVTNAQYAYNPQFVNNRMTVNPVTGAAMSYDAAGHLLNDGQQTFTYDAQGQQATASGTSLSQSYDGDSLRIKKTENGVATYYLRSSILGGQVVLEIGGTSPNVGQMMRGYVYLGSQMLAIQDGSQTNGAVLWVHQDPVTKSQRLTDGTGVVVSAIDLDPWGGETARSSNQGEQPHRFTTYERDGNSGDEAMFRRYESKWQRVSQPDPYDGSYDFSDPQSLNRYAYTQNDPVNFTDPTGLFEYWEPDTNPHSGDNFLWFIFNLNSIFDGFEVPEEPNVPNVGAPPPNRTSCERMAADAQSTADRITEIFKLGVNDIGNAVALQLFNQAFGMITFGSYFTPAPWGFVGTQASGRNNVFGTRDYQGQDGFAEQFHDESETTRDNPNPDQVHHFGAYFSAGLVGHKWAPDQHRADDRERRHFGDVRLADQSRRLGDYLRRNPTELAKVGQLIRDSICSGKDVPK